METIRWNDRRHKAACAGIALIGLCAAGCSPATSAGNESHPVITAVQASQAQDKQMEAVRNNNAMPPEVRQRLLARYEANKRGQH